MTARSGSSYPPAAEPAPAWAAEAGAGRRAVLAAAVGLIVLTVVWTLLHHGWYAHRRIVDTPIYRQYGDAMTRGQVPYRDFAVEYPPGALPTFVLPALGPSDRYDRLFETLMLLCAAAAVGLVAATLGAVGAGRARLYGAVVFVAAAPLLLGSLVLTRFDFWPAALLAGALAAFVSGRERLGFAALALAVAAKGYPLVVLPLALVHVGRRRGGREAAVGLGIFALVLAAIIVPFGILGPHGLVESVRNQAGRPLQLESLGSSLLLAAHQLGVYDSHVVSSHGSQNLGGGLPDALATVASAFQVVAVVAVWVLFAARPRHREAFLVASVAAVVAFVAFDRVLSPQFMIWLLPLVPLVAGRIGLAASALLATALVLTQLWFPQRYWHLVALSPAAWLVLARDLVLVALFALLFAAIRREPAALGSS